MTMVNNKEILRRLCQKSNEARLVALENELQNNNVKFENWNNMAVRIPGAAENVVIVTAHFDAVEGSFGFNDNGMALVAALNMCQQLPHDVEIIFTNDEEKGGGGAQYFLEHSSKHISGCVNLDVIGCFNQIYLDCMNCSAAAALTNCKQGHMPFNDAWVFAEAGIPSVCFSSGPAEMTFQRGIRAVCSTLHNGPNDNNINLMNFKMIPEVISQVRNVIELMKSA
ncbi:MAG: Zn-dependent exopeptidase M28 [Lentisphaerae bacterium]|nr:Zn-dependent exopeptidase M28 [Lentisphaerota bacterium]MBE6406280.1 Zn-dependent exopeptidase M28 [Lentisphaerota bacterium]